MPPCRKQAMPAPPTRTPSSARPVVRPLAQPPVRTLLPRPAAPHGSRRLRGRAGRRSARAADPARPGSAAPRSPRVRGRADGSTAERRAPWVASEPWVDREHLPLAGPQHGDEEAAGGLDRDWDRILGAVAVLGEQIQQDLVAGGVVGDVALGDELTRSRSSPLDLEFGEGFELRAVEAVAPLLLLPAPRRSRPRRRSGRPTTGPRSGSAIALRRR